MRVLISEEYHASRSSLARAAESLGHEVLTASDEAEAWEILEGTPDIGAVVGGWGLQTDASELYRRIRQAEGGEELLVLLTGPGEGDQAARSVEAGADDYLVEPVEADELERRLGHAENGSSGPTQDETGGSPEEYELENHPREEQYIEQAALSEAPSGALTSNEGNVGQLPPRRRRGSLRDVLLSQGKITEEQLQRALEAQGTRGLGEVLLGMGFLTKEDLARAEAERLGLQYIEVLEKDVDRGALELVPEKVLRRHRALPLRVEDNRLVVAVSDPNNLHAMDDLSMISGYSISAVVATEEEIGKVQTRFFTGGESLSGLMEEAEGADEEEESQDLELGGGGDAEERPVIRLVSSILQQAVSDGASDIHVEPRPGGVTVRMRVDGVLREAMNIPPRLQSGVIARFKIIGNLDIAERRVPQDGRFSVKLSSKKVDFRVASLPTVHGEKLVLRLMDTSSVETDLRKLGFAPEIFKAYEKIFSRPYGAILVTGPTGSGKSTTLYATLNELNSEEKNIITVEDPVELRVEGVNQIQVNPRAGLTFASGLRSILRADPDIVMIGEIRDQDTAKISIEAALTGHLVLATLHTNNAPGALTRLTEMGVEPFLTSSAVDCVIAQRLARKLCPRCKERTEIEQEVLEDAGFPFDKISGEPKFYKAVGCERCGGTGYRGRVGIYELMVVTEDLRELILRRASTSEVSHAAEEGGMVRLREDGLLKAARGLTSLEEVLRTVL